MPPADLAAGDAAALRARRDAAGRAFDARGPVIVASGAHVPIAGTDQFHDFHAHPDFAFLGGPAGPLAVLAFEPGEGWLLFAHVPGQEERVWTGDLESPAALAAGMGISLAWPLAALVPWLERHRGRPVAVLGNDDIAEHRERYALDGWAALELDRDHEAEARMTEVLAEARRTKDARELALMRQAAAASAAGHRWAMRQARAGMTERALQVEVEAEFFRHGALRTAYGSIVGSGPNAAILHGAPTPRTLAGGDLLLMDAGAEVGGYASDVTRTFPVAARFEGAQRDLYALVLDVQSQAIAAVQPGKEYRDLHLDASQRIAAGLAGLGILRGNPTSLVERDAHALFFPHGLGHMLGLATHDAGGCLAGRPKSDRFGLKWLRADLPLQPGYVVTIEPGIYFIRALLEDPARRATFADAVHWDRVDKLLDFGGIRIEDDVLVTADGPEVLSARIPKSIAEIESLRAEAMGR